MDGSEASDTGERKNNDLNQQLDYLDPSIDLRDLFVSFNKLFFRDELQKVEVKFSYTMTSQAGLCSFDEQGGGCTIELSAPLLNPRPRKEMVEALLHEMIHAYLFVTRNFMDKEDHGPEFQKHMRRINEEGGMNINIYCDFIGDMSATIWRCAGPCRDQKPFFGFFAKTINEPPGSTDDWWRRHMQECGGNFEKITHEEKDKGQDDKEKTKKGKGKRKQTGTGAKGTFFKRFGPETPSKSDSSDASPSSTTVDESDKGESSKSNDQKKGKPGNSNKTEGEPGTTRPGDDTQARPGSSRYSDDTQARPGSSRYSDDYQPRPGSSRYSDDFQSEPENSPPDDYNVRPKTRRIKKKGNKGKKRKSSDPYGRNTSEGDRKRQNVSCPICNHLFDIEIINDHVNACMEDQDLMNEIPTDENARGGRGSDTRGYVDEIDQDVRSCLYYYVHDEDLLGDDEPGTGKVYCPCCWKWVIGRRINEHIDACLTYFALRKNPEFH